MSKELLSSLNEEQKQAVIHKNGPLMIIAGAGTGKTTVVTQRIAWIIDRKWAKPDEILALTFTEKAATEMEERVDLLLPFGYVDLWISTFHAFCERILHAHAVDIGLPHEFSLATEIDALLLVRKNFDSFHLDYYKPKSQPTRFIKALLSHFSRLKDECISPEVYISYAEEKMKEAKKQPKEQKEEYIAEAQRLQEVAGAYARYQEVLLENHVLDFGDLVFYCLELFRTRPNILAKYQKQFKYILVDEFQDTNLAQYELVKLLTKKDGNITIVGDDDQSIYQFRGAALGNILRFREDFPTATKVVLTKNYRSTEQILTGAYALIQNNNPNRLEVQEGLDKTLISQTKEVGVVEHIHVHSSEDEVMEVMKRIAEIKNREKCAWNEFAVLVRANEHAKPFVHEFDRQGIPYRFMAMAGLYTKSIILDALAYLRVIDQVNDSPSMFRILSHPSLGVSQNTVSELSLYCRKKTKTLFQSMQEVGGIPEVTPEDQERIQEILQLIEDISVQAARLPVTELFVEVMKSSGILGYVRQHTELEQQEQFGLLQQFFERLRRFEQAHDEKTLRWFLEDFSYERDAGESGALATDIESGPDVVNIMTIHSSKGLEFSYVFIVDLVEQRFPSRRKSDPIEIPADLMRENTQENLSARHIEEERRLFYVAMTRAKKELYLVSAEDYGGARKRKRSRFLEELEIERAEPLKESTFIHAPVEQEEKRKKAIYTLPKNISFTQVAAFSNCPLQYKFAHILKVPVFGRHSLSFGKSMHNTLQKYMQRILDQMPESSPSTSKTKKNIKIPGINTMMKLYEKSWIDEWYPTVEVKDEYFEKGREVLREVVVDAKKHPPNVAFIEKGFTLKVGGVSVRGRIDRIDHHQDGYEIIDYKTGKPKTRLTWQEKRQLVLYQLAAEECFDPPLTVKALTFHYLEDNSKVTFTVTEKQKEKLRDEIRETVDLIKESDFSATPGFHCQYCDFKDICEFSQA